MTLRHAAALAVIAISACNSSSPKSVSCYLMTPPSMIDANGMPLVGPDVKAPLSRWQKGEQEDQTTHRRFEAFESRLACEDYRAKLVANARDQLSSVPRNIESQPSLTRYVRWAFMLAAVNAQCVASDDPRLKSHRPDSRVFPPPYNPFPFVLIG
jgi:hypothetical protein